MIENKKKLKLSDYKGQLRGGIQYANRYTFEVDGLFEKSEYHGCVISTFSPIVDSKFKVQYYALLDDDSSLEHIVNSFVNNLDKILDFKFNLLLNDCVTSTLKYDGMIKLKDFYFCDFSWEKDELLKINVWFEVKKIDIVKD